MEFRLIETHLCHQVEYLKLAQITNEVPAFKIISVINLDKNFLDTHILIYLFTKIIRFYNPFIF